MMLIAIGANLPGEDGRSARMTCEAAAQAVASLPGLRLGTLSSWYETTPVPPSGQPLYCNGVILLEGSAAPAALLSALQAIEQAHGRARGVVNAARTLDLDIIDMDGLVRSTPDPVLPHPRLHERAFVLQPLLDVSPDWRHPVSGVSARALLAALPPQGVRSIE